MFNSCDKPQKPDRTILFVIDGMPSGLHLRIEMPSFSRLIQEGVLYNEVYLPLAAHPDSTAEYPWTCSIPNPVLMSGTVFIGQEGIKENLIQHSFNDRPTAFYVNAWTYSAISQGFTYFEDLSTGQFVKVFQDELPIEAAKKIILEKNPEFIRIHCQGPGSAGHQSHRIKGQPFTGNIWHPDSPFIRQHQYVDSLLGTFLDWLKINKLWENTVLIVMGDHGQAKVGGHPPYEQGGYTTQMVVAGANINKGLQYDYAEIIDIAPTIAWLHHVPCPKYSNGRVLEEVMIGKSRVNDTTTPMKELNEALLYHHENKSECNSLDFFTIEQIGIWHTGSHQDNYYKFVNQQKEKLFNQVVQD